MKKIILLIITLIFIIFAAFFFWKNNTKLKSFKIIPSDENIFTQGIFIKNNTIFLSSGSPTQFPQTNSVVWILENGKFIKKFEVDKNIFFGEWSTLFRDKIYFITWKNKKGFILDSENFQKTGEFTYESEWWGLTNNENFLIMSDGSDKISFFDENFHLQKQISVHENTQKITKINELEFIDSSIFANIWLTNDIIKINPKTGEITKRWNFDFLKNIELQQNPNAQEMNGIAFDKEKNQVILTGKMWAHLYVFNKKYFQ